MPGILPMKVIKVGANAQTRIAQACDRCRSKKIRCDGIRPCCSQCANVGFECKTSDKLSRRAFPRGYTESLEERVRCLETEVRELKELLDEKDEKIDMLSKIHSQSSQPIRLPSPRRSSVDHPPSAHSDSATEPPSQKDETFKVQQSSYLLHGNGTSSYFSGTSSSKTFIDAFKQKVQETGRSTADINTGTLLSSGQKRLRTVSQSVDIWKAPPRLVADQMVNIFFQEWAPLFPVLHRPTFLSLYESYVATPEAITDKASLAQLNLVFGLAALSSGSQDLSSDLASFEVQWQAALASLLSDHTIAALQCLVLAQLYCIQRGDYAKLSTYKGLAVSLSSRLGLHQSQKRFALGTLTCETRKKVFWTLYTIDSFSAVLLGLPKQLKDDDVHCEYPVDADDEYVSERGFQATLPGESTKLSSALALFRGTRVLSRVLEEVYPALPSYDLSLQTLSALSDELDKWSSSLAPHLRLTFAQDKPSTGTISSRSPLLSLTYHYIRALIHRPAVCASLGRRSHSSMIAMAGSCKHIVQIMQLLTERGLSFSFCLNKEELLVLSGFGLLYQGLELDANSKLLKDNQKMIGAVVLQLDRAKALCASEFRRVACSFLPVPSPQPTKSTALGHPPLSRHNSDGGSTMPAPQNLSSAAKKQLKAVAARFMTANSKPSKLPSSVDHRRATEPNITMYRHSLQTHSQPNVSIYSNYDPAHVSRSEPARSPTNIYSRPAAVPRPSAPPASERKHPAPAQSLNLDYLSFAADNSAARSQTPATVKTEPSDWERLLGSIDNGQTNIFDNIYGGPPVDALTDIIPPLPANPAANVGDSLAWSPDIWALSEHHDNRHFSKNFAGASLSTSVPAPQSESVLSFSSADEGLGSNDEVPIADWASASSGTEIPGEVYRGIVMPDLGSGDEGLLGDCWDAVFAN